MIAVRFGASPAREGERGGTGSYVLVNIFPAYVRLLCSSLVLSRLAGCLLV